LAIALIRRTIAGYSGFWQPLVAPSVKPVLQALLLADHIYEDRTTGKRIVAGIFNRLHGRRNKPEPPASGESVAPAAGGNAPGTDEPRLKKPLGGPEVGSPYVYISITEIYQSLLLQLKYVDLSDNTALITLDININVDKPNPLQTMELTVPLPSKLPAPHAGTYALELWHDGEVLGSLRVLVEIEG
jgi:hypothetical protein